MERLVKFEVLGQEYPLSTDAPEEDVQEILNLVRSSLEQTGHSSSLPVNKLAILTSINMAGKYVKLKRDFDAYRIDLEGKIDQLQDKIGHVL